MVFPQLLYPTARQGHAYARFAEVATWAAVTQAHHFSRNNCSVSLLGRAGSVTSRSSPSWNTGGSACVSSLRVILSLYSCCSRMDFGFCMKIMPLDPETDGLLS